MVTRVLSSAIIALFLLALTCQAQTAGQAKQKQYADRLLEQARTAASEWTKAKQLEALKIYERAGPIYEAIGDTRSQLVVLLESGRILECSGDAQIALTKYTRALTLARDGRDQRSEAGVLNRIGFWYIDRSKYEKAFDYGEEARALSVAIKDRRNEAEALLLLGTASYHRRKVEPPGDYLRSSLAISSIDGEINQQARALEMLAHVDLDQGNTGEALRLFKESHELAQRANNLKLTGKILNGLAITFSIMGEKQEAVEYHRQALAIFEKIGDRLHEAIALNGLGFIYHTVGQNEKSLNYYYKAVELFKAVGDREGEGIALARIGKNSEASWDKDTAVRHYERVRTIAKESNDPVFESYAVNWLGDAVSGSDMRQALSYYEQALALTRNKNPRNEGYTLNRLGHAHAALGEIEIAQNYYNTALKFAQTINDRESESLTLYNLAVMERNRNSLDHARSLIEQSLKLIESLSTAAGDRELRASYFATVHQHYEFYIDLLMALHQQNRSADFDSKALEASERSRARSLLEMLGEGRADIRQGVDPQLLDQEKTARERLANALTNRFKLFTGKHSQQEAEDSQREILTLTTEHEQILSAIRQKSPRYAALTQPPALSTQQMQELLDDDSLMVEFALGDRKSFAWTLTRNSIDSYELPDRTTVEKLARTVYEEIANPPDAPAVKSRRPSRDEYTQAIRNLSRILLDPLAKHPDKKRIVVIADGALQYVPFSVLELASATSDKRLITKYEIVNLPSASALAVQRHSLAERQAAPRALAVVADPVFKLDDDRFLLARLGTGRSSTRGAPARNAANQQRGLDHEFTDVGRVLRNVGLGEIGRLPFSGQEAESVFKLISPADGLKAVGFKANREIVLGTELGRYRMLHFATHGFVDNEQPQLSGLMLSRFDEQGRKQNGFLTLYEIYNLRLSADLVVLSACQTALGKQIRGEGIVGLTRGFMYAGARQVVASLWRVDDSATADLMREFYKGMLVDGLKPADALRSAQRELSKQKLRQHPYYWAGFVLQGEWM